MEYLSRTELLATFPQLEPILQTLCLDDDFDKSDLFWALSFYWEEAITKNDHKEVCKILNFVEEYIDLEKKLDLEMIKMIFLETIVNNIICNSNNVRYLSIINLLGPKSKQLCLDIDKYWGTKTPGLYTS